MTDITAATATAILNYISTRAGHTIGAGECYDLANEALSNAKAKRASDFGAITPTADYVWGRAIGLGDVKPGDVIQFKDYEYNLSSSDDDGNSTTGSESRPHHTAVVASVGTNGQLEVWEQNVNGSRTAQKNKLYFTSGTFSSGGANVTVNVSGTTSFYRPQAK